MKKIFFSNLIVAAILSFIGCQKTNTAINTQVTGTQGKVLLTDSSGLDTLSNSSGTTISISGTAKPIQVITDAGGNFVIPVSKATGQVQVQYSHVGYATIKQSFTSSFWDSLQQNLIGYSPFVSVITPTSSVLVNSLTGTIQNDTLKLQCNVSGANTTWQHFVIVFFARNDTTVSPSNFYASRMYSVNNGENTIKVCLCENICNTWQPGYTISMKAFGAVPMPTYITQLTPGYNLPLAYMDPATKNMVYPSINAKSNAQTLNLLIP